MASTQPQIARSSDVANFLVFSVQGRVVERSTSQWRPEVFVAGIYPGCRVNLISVRVISVLQSHLARACTEQQQRSEGKKALLRSRASLSLSGNYFCNSCMLVVPWLQLAMLYAPRGVVLLCRQYELEWRRHAYALQWNHGDDRLCTQLNGGISNHK